MRTKKIVAVVFALLIAPSIAFAVWGGYASSQLHPGLYDGDVHFNTADGGNECEARLFLECVNWEVDGGYYADCRKNGGNIPELTKAEYVYDTHTIELSMIYVGSDSLDFFHFGAYLQDAYGDVHGEWGY